MRGIVGLQYIAGVLGRSVPACVAQIRTTLPTAAAYQAAAARVLGAVRPRLRTVEQIRANVRGLATRDPLASLGPLGGDPVPPAGGEEAGVLRRRRFLFGHAVQAVNADATLHGTVRLAEFPPAEASAADMDAWRLAFCEHTGALRWTFAFLRGLNLGPATEDLLRAMELDLDDEGGASRTWPVKGAGAGAKRAQAAQLSPQDINRIDPFSLASALYVAGNGGVQRGFMHRDVLTFGALWSPQYWPLPLQAGPAQLPLHGQALDADLETMRNRHFGPGVNRVPDVLVRFPPCAFALLEAVCGAAQSAMASWRHGVFRDPAQDGGLGVGLPPLVIKDGWVSRARNVYKCVV